MGGHETNRGGRVNWNRDSGGGYAKDKCQEEAKNHQKSGEVKGEREKRILGGKEGGANGGGRECQSRQKHKYSWEGRSKPRAGS